MRITLLFALIITPCLVQAGSSTGRVEPIEDGDTIVVLDSGNASHSPGLQRVDAPDRKPVPGTQSKENLPDGWQPLTFSRIDRHTEYSLVEDGDTVVVKAVSEQSASGLTRAVSIDPVEYPVIQWRWKVNNVLQKGDVTSKDGDDYPARIYITFAFDPDRAGYLERLEHEATRLIRGEDVPYRAISYIWGSNSPAGTMIENSYTERAMMFVVQAGSERLQQWVTERRNVYEDYKMAFGEEPTMISGVAIMTDTDNTRESATAWYGDIVFRKEQGKP
ncbi:MAG: DUF3047 domain-containing protein [Gammaproteobacteria bacterium]|nr:DUF3047 domain-containing protein [Gammaproteobacteria bacterium]